MKILLAADTYPPDVNGAAYFTYRLANTLRQHGHVVGVVVPSRSLKISTTQEEGIVRYGIPSIPVLFYPGFRFSPPFFGGKSMQKIVHEFLPDVVHIQGHIFVGRMAARKAMKLGIPVIGTNHFMPENLVHYLHLPRAGEDVIKAMAWKHFSQLYSDLDVITAPTATAARLLENVGFQKKVIPVSCGIDLKRFNPKNRNASMRKRYGIPSSRPVALCVSRVDKDKNIDVVIHAISRVLKSGTDIHLVVAGIGAEMANLEKLTRKLGAEKNVTFAGFAAHEDLPHLYASSDVFVAAGHAELQSIATMEAMASGLPVVAVNATALPELVHDGENGFLFPLNDSATLAERIKIIVNDPKLMQRMGRKSLEIIQPHDIQKVVGTFESLYVGAIAAKNSK